MSVYLICLAVACNRPTEIIKLHDVFLVVWYNVMVVEACDLRGEFAMYRNTILYLSNKQTFKKKGHLIFMVLFFLTFCYYFWSCPMSMLYKDFHCNSCSSITFFLLRMCLFFCIVITCDDDDGIFVLYFGKVSDITYSTTVNYEVVM